MTDPTATEAVAPDVERDASVAPRSPREELRVQLLLLVPPTDVVEDAVMTDDEFDSAALSSRSSWEGYHQGALVEFILGEFDRAVAAQAFLGAADEVLALEESQAAIVELATASATFSSLIEWERYLTQLAGVLRQGLKLADQWDLARTLEAEVGKVRGILGGLVERFPQLQAVMSDTIGTRAQTLVLPGDQR